MCGGKQKAPTAEMTPAQKEQIRIDAELWNYYQTEYRPKIETFAKGITSPKVQEEERRKVAGQVRGEIMKTVDPSKVSPNPVETAKMLSGLAGMETGAQVKGGAVLRKRQLGEMQNIINIGRGEATEAEAGIGYEAAQALSGEIFEKEMEQQVRGVTEEAIAGGIGTGVALLTRPKTKTPTTSTRTLYPQDYFSELGYSGW